MKHLIMAPVLVFLALAQQSFLNQFSIMGTAPNFVFIASFILIFFSCLQKPGKFYHNYQGMFFTLMAGFLLDVFSPYYFGAAISALLLVFMIISVTIESLKQIQDRYLFIYFILIFIACFIFYNIVLYLFLHIADISININQRHGVELTYNLVIASLGFFLYKILFVKNTPNRQLKLFI